MRDKELRKRELRSWKPHISVDYFFYIIHSDWVEWATLRVSKSRSIKCYDLK